MQLSEFDFPFDPSLIASEPTLPRDRARLLVLHPTNQSLIHRHIADLPELLSPGDLLIVNDTKVRPARVSGKHKPSGRVVEMLFVREMPDRAWEVLVKGKLKPGQIFDVGPDVRVIIRSSGGGQTIVDVECPTPIREFFQRHGSMPLPPYIKREPNRHDMQWYQTVFAQEEGAVAAPTAGLHFTPDLLARLSNRSIRVAYITLHVGIGTFRPVTVEQVSDHRMGAEWVVVERQTIRAIQETKVGGGRIVAVGTTVVRALEAAAEEGELKPFRGSTTLFITPGFHFRVIDVLMTNFHLPKTTLLMLVSAFAGTSFLQHAYEEAIRERYRFYSYGDAMLIMNRHV